MYFFFFFRDGSTKDMYMAYVALIGSPIFWLLTLVLIIAALIPDMVLSAWNNLVPPGRVSWDKFMKVIFFT
jgi:hypothetical protein